MGKAGAERAEDVGQRGGAAGLGELALGHAVVVDEGGLDDDGRLLRGELGLAVGEEGERRVGDRSAGEGAGERERGATHPHREPPQGWRTDLWR